MESLIYSGAKGLIVYDIPSKDEYLSNRPLVGPTATLYDLILSKANIDKELFNVTYLVQEPLAGLHTVKRVHEAYTHIEEQNSYTPKGNLRKKKKKVEVLNDEVQQWYGDIVKLIDKTKPNLLIAGGELPAKVLGNVHSITKYRGSIFEHANQKTGFCLSPDAFIMQNQWKLFYPTVYDFRKFKLEAEYPDVRKSSYITHIQPTFEAVIEFVRCIANNDVRWCLDIETRAGSIACIGLGFCIGRDFKQTTQAMCIPIQTTTGAYFSAQEEATVWVELSKMFSTNPNLVGQNLVFDLDWFLDYGIEPCNILHDTMIQHFICYPEMQKGLDFMCSCYTDTIYYKDEGKTWSKKVPDVQLWTYNLKDIFYTLWLSFDLESHIERSGFTKLYQDYGLKLIPLCLEMQQRGIPADQLKQMELAQVISDEKDALHERVCAHTSGINLQSPKQVAAFIYGKKKEGGLGLKPVKDRKTGQVTTKEDAMMKLLMQNPDLEILRDIMKEKHLIKAFDYVYVDLDERGNLRGAWNPCGTKTWRMSSEKHYTEGGFNLQTNPKVLRVAYPAPPGRIFVQPDLKQAEARVVGYLAECQAQIDLFNDPSRSIHLELGRDIFGKVEKDTPQYTASKSGIHGGNFRMQPMKLSMTSGIPVTVCKMALEGYHRKYPEIRNVYHQWVKDIILKKGYLENPFGWKRIFFAALAKAQYGRIFDTDDWNDGCSWIPQTVCPAIVNRALIQLVEYDWFWLHQQGHDSFLASVPVDHLEMACQEIEHCLTIPIKIKGRELIIPVEHSAGYNWGCMMPWEGGIISYGQWNEWAGSERSKGKVDTPAYIIKNIYGVL